MKIVAVCPETKVVVGDSPKLGEETKLSLTLVEEVSTESVERDKSDMVVGTVDPSGRGMHVCPETRVVEINSSGPDEAEGLVS